MSILALGIRVGLQPDVAIRSDTLQVHEASRRPRRELLAPRVGRPGRARHPPCACIVFSIFF